MLCVLYFISWYLWRFPCELQEEMLLILLSNLVVKTKDVHHISVYVAFSMLGLWLVSSHSLVSVH